MSEKPLSDRIIARVKFIPGITADRIATAVGHEPVCYIKETSTRTRIPDTFTRELEKLVESGEIQEFYPTARATPCYYPKGHKLPQRRETPMDRRDETPESLSRANRRTFEQVTEALWEALEHFRREGKPFTEHGVMARANSTSYSVLEKRPVLRAAIREAIAIQGRPTRSPSRDSKIAIGGNHPQIQKSA